MKGMWHCGVGVLLWNRRVRQSLFNTVHLSKDWQKMSFAEEDHSGQEAGGGGCVQRPQEGLWLVGICEEQCRGWKGEGPLG